MSALLLTAMAAMAAMAAMTARTNGKSKSLATAIEIIGNDNRKAIGNGIGNDQAKGDRRMRKPIETVLQDKIASVAQQKAQGRGHKPGQELDDWLLAQQEVVEATRSQGTDALLNDQAITIADQLSNALQQRIARKAYWRAAERNFAPGYVLDDWLEAEKAVELEVANKIGASITYPTIRDRIADLAYQRAKERGFAPGHEQEDWFAAERAIEAQLEMAEISSPIPEAQAMPAGSF